MRIFVLEKKRKSLTCRNETLGERGRPRILIVLLLAHCQKIQSYCQASVFLH